MSKDEMKELEAFRQAKSNRKLQVKKYFARRNVRFDFYKKYFEQHANEQDKQNLANLLGKI